MIRYLSKIENWRPLTLLNVDYKILSKILAHRLEIVLPQIIHDDQVGFMKNRSMNDNLMDLLTAVEYCNCKKVKEPMLLISYDIQKAFDSVEHNILFEIMRSMNIGEKYINMVKQLYKQNESCTINCGYTSKYFPITRSLRQGCPLSAPCYLILAELLGKMIRNSSIEGLSLDNFNKKAGQFADDLWMLIKDNPENFSKAINLVQKFGEKTGLHMNYDKTQVMRIASMSKSNARYYSEKPMHWSESVKILGIHIYNNVQEHNEK